MAGVRLNKRESKIIDLLLQWGSEEIRKDFRADCCVAGTRIAIDVLNYFEISATPLVVEYIAMNEAFMKLLIEYKGLPPIEAQDAVGAWAVGVDTGEDRSSREFDPTGLHGHLVAVVDKTMVDLTINQANRPAKQLVLPDGLTVKIPEDFWQGRALLVPAGDAFVSYRILSNPPLYEDAPDWWDASRHTAVLRLIRRINHGLGTK